MAAVDRRCEMPQPTVRLNRHLSVDEKSQSGLTDRSILELFRMTHINYLPDLRAMRCVDDLSAILRCVPAKDYSQFDDQSQAECNGITETINRKLAELKAGK